MGHFLDELSKLWLTIDTEAYSNGNNYNNWLENNWIMGILFLAFIVYMVIIYFYYKKTK